MRLYRLLALLTTSIASGCAQPAPDATRFELSLTVRDDAQTPVAGAAILRDGRALGTSQTDGTLRIALDGIEGDRIALGVRCPENYLSPSAPVVVSLRRLGEGTLPTYGATCAPELRTVVVAVRALNGPNLPVRYLGKDIARTDQSGAAHVELKLRSSTRFELELSTTEEPNLLPQNPVAVFVVKDKDELLFFDQKFDRPAPRVKRAAQRPKAF